MSRTVAPAKPLRTNISRLASRRLRLVSRLCCCRVSVFRSIVPNSAAPASTHDPAYPDIAQRADENGTINQIDPRELADIEIMRVEREGSFDDDKRYEIERERDHQPESS